MSITGHCQIQTMSHLGRYSGLVDLLGSSDGLGDDSRQTKKCRTDSHCCREIVSSCGPGRYSSILSMVEQIREKKAKDKPQYQNTRDIQNAWSTPCHEKTPMMATADKRDWKGQALIR